MCLIALNTGLKNRKHSTQGNCLGNVACIPQKESLERLKCNHCCLKSLQNAHSSQFFFQYQIGHCCWFLVHIQFILNTDSYQLASIQIYKVPHENNLHFKAKIQLPEQKKASLRNKALQQDLSEHIYMGVYIENSIEKLMSLCLKSEFQKDNKDLFSTHQLQIL